MRTLSPAFEPRLVDTAVHGQSRARSPLRSVASALLWLFVLTIPWEDQWLVPGLGTLSRAAGLVAFGMAALAVLAEGRVRKLTPAHLGLAIFVGWVTLSCWWSIDPELSWISSKTYLQLLAMVWLIWEFAPSELEQIRLMQAYVLGSYVSAIGTILNYLAGSAAYWQRYVATGFDANDLCVMLALSLPMSLYLSIGEPRGWRSWVWKLHWLPAIFAILLTASRGGFLATLVALLALPAFYHKLPRSTTVFRWTVTFVLVVMIVVWVPSTSFERLATTLEEISHGSLNERKTVWLAGLELFAVHPILGVGAGAFAPAVAPILGEPISAHNTFLTVLVEQGFIGFVLMAIPASLLLMELLSLPSIERRLWTILLGSWFVGAMALSWAHRKPGWLLLGLLAAQAHSRMSLHRGQRERRERFRHVLT